MSSGSRIPGPKPPAAPVKRKVRFASPIDDVGSLNASHLSDRTQEYPVIRSNRIEEVLNRPTSEIVQEASAVATFAIGDSKTVGGLGVNLLTLCALVATSPWSWIGMLLFGPMRVWGLFYAGVIGGIGTALGMIFVALIILSLSLIGLFGWILTRAIS